MLPFYLHCLSRGDDIHISLYLYLQKIILVQVCVVCGMWRLENNVSVFCPFAYQFQELNLGHQAWWKAPVPLPAKPPRQTTSV